jgi:hypothetical protein
MAVYQGPEPAAIITDFFVDARVQLVVQRE